MITTNELTLQNVKCQAYRVGCAQNNPTIKVGRSDILSTNIVLLLLFEAMLKPTLSYSVTIVANRSLTSFIINVSH